MNIIYADSLFLLNLTTDYLLCLCAARVCSLRLRRWRYLAAALLGAAYSVAVFLPGLGFLSGAAGKLLTCLAMGLICFGGERRPLRCTGVFLAVSAAFGGAVWAVGLASGSAFGGGLWLTMDLKSLLCAFAVCYCGVTVFLSVRSKLSERKRVPVSVRFLGETAQFTALCDSGNGLSDPLTGSAVLIACPHALRGIFKTELAVIELKDPVELLETASQCPALSGKLRLIPYRALGVRSLLPVFRPESVIVDGQARSDLLVAISAEAAGDGFEGIV